MCGICGFVGSGTLDDLTRMTDALVHRGPDGSGYYVDVDNGIYLGHRRLAIVDVAGGQQPMWNEDERIGIVFNGEIYNHRELRRELEAHGHEFKSDHSDTEVLIHGYEEWGDGLPLRLNGMFAFAILDLRKREVFLARDRFGEKPLYYSLTSDGLIFASELTSLICHSRVSRSIHSGALQKFFAYGYVPAPLTVLENAKKVPGGNWLRYCLTSKQIKLTSYWDYQIQANESLSDRDEEKLVDECAHLIRQATRRRMMSDVPLGIFLSGGLDSSVITAFATQEDKVAKVSTFAIGFEDPSFDESIFAQRVADHLGTLHFHSRLKFADARDIAERVLAKPCDLLADSSILPTSMLCAFTRKHVTVALTGDGGDELFAGYDPFLALKPARAYRRLMPRLGHQALVRMSDFLPASDKNISLDFKIKRFLQGVSCPVSFQLPAWMSPLDLKSVQEIFETSVRAEDLFSEAISLYDSDPQKNDIDKALEFYGRFYLQDDVLMKSDRASMMHSLEARAVFLDNDVVEFAQRLPARFKLRGQNRKYLLKKVAKRLLPPDIINRKKKGFGAPMTKWFKDGFNSEPLDYLQGMQLVYASKAFEAHKTGKQDFRLFLWAWLVAQNFIKQIRR